MPKARWVGRIALGLCLGAPAVARAGRPMLALAPLLAGASVRPLVLSATRLALLAGPTGRLQALLKVVPREPFRYSPANTDVDGMARRFLGRHLSFYVGNNLARGDMTAVRTFGLKFLFP